MLRINEVWLEQIWACTYSDHLADWWWEDMQYEKNVQTLVRDYLTPYFDLLPTKVHIRLKETWRYAINFSDEATLRRAVRGQYGESRAPEDIRGFYKAAWAGLFPSEPWEIEHKHLYELSNHLRTPFENIGKQPVNR